MAGWIVVAMVMVGLVGLVVGFVFGRIDGRTSEQLWMTEQVKERLAQPPSERSDMLDIVLERLLSAVVPPHQERAEEKPEEDEGVGEYQPPDDAPMDWTDAVIGEERPMVMGVPPGAGIPGMLSYTDEAQVADANWHHMGAEFFPGPPEPTSWVDPVDLGGDD